MLDLPHVSLKHRKTCRRQRRTDLKEDRVVMLVLWGASSVGWVLPVDVKPIELVLPQKHDDRVDEGLAIGGTGHHG